MRQGARVAGGMLGVAILLIGWQMLAQALYQGRLIAGPVGIVEWLGRDPGLALRALARTLGNAAAGFALGNLAAILLAGIAFLWPRLQDLVTGLALVAFCLPLIATGPILRVLMGPGEGPQIVLAALAVQYTTLIPLLTGLRAVPAAWLDLIHSYGRGRWVELAHIRARAALPYLFAGLQIGAPAAVLGAMVGEFTGAERGLGVLTIRYMRDLDVPALWGVALLAAGASLAAYWAIGGLARLVLDTRPPVLLAPPMRQLRTGRVVGGLTLALAVLLLWWGGLWLTGLNPFLAKGPWDVLAALVWAPDATQMRAALFGALRESAGLAVPGYLAGLAAGAGLAILLTLLPGAGPLVMPVAVALRAIPIVTTGPLIVLFLGRGALGTITLVAVMVFFPTLVACLHGLRQAPGHILDLLRVHAAGPLSQMIHVRIPAMLPALFAAARISVPTAILAVTVVEWLATGRGLGSLMALAASTSDFRMLWSAVALITLLAVLCHAVVAGLERRVLARYAPEQLRQ
ncbi:ABC transporter permease [Paracoccus litorisediminis]|uniref:ABC transporter permease n=1 Tax=Paracoccus litorisediminis TaxID=2006130 RepID=UPI0012B94071|nr:ABC transporter permease subunit [Paracoccus litorisediminis]